MGMLRVQFKGSFGERESEVFSAMKLGHAAAVAAAIEYLARVEMPKAIASDHKLHEQGHLPAEGFGVAKESPHA